MKIKKRITKLFSFLIHGGIMKNIFIEEMNFEECCLEELLVEETLLNLYKEKGNEEAVTYYQQALVCSLQLLEEESSES